MINSSKLEQPGDKSTLSPELAKLHDLIVACLSESNISHESDWLNCAFIEPASFPNKSIFFTAKSKISFKSEKSCPLSNPPSNKIILLAFPSLCASIAALVDATLVDFESLIN